MSYFPCNICGQYKGMIDMVWHPCACPVQNQNKPVASLPSSEGTVKTQASVESRITVTSSADSSSSIPASVQADRPGGGDSWNEYMRTEGYKGYPCKPHKIEYCKECYPDLASAAKPDIDTKKLGQITEESVYCRDCEEVRPVHYDFMKCAVKTTGNNHDATDILCDNYHIIATLHHPSPLAKFLGIGKSETVPTEAAKPPKEKMLDLLYEASHNLRLAAAEAYACGDPKVEHQALKLSSAIDVLKIRTESLKP